MAGYQFAHLSTFSMKGNSKNRAAGAILAEAARVPDHCLHVDAPEPPQVLHGIPPLEALAELERRVAAAKKAARGQGRGKGIRKDTHVLLAGVFSHPAYCRRPPAGHEGEERPHLEDPAELERYERWRADTVKWALEDCQKRGLDVLCVVEHQDEAHPHIHVIACPCPTAERLDARQHHPGHVAKSAAAGDGATPKAQNAAYRAAMRGWQDDYHREVGIRHGLNRLGPRRRRVDRSTWKLEQAQAEATAQRLAEIGRTEQNAQETAAAILADAERRARAQLDAADREAAATREGAQRDAQAIREAAEARRIAVEGDAATAAAKTKAEAEERISGLNTAAQGHNQRAIDRDRASEARAQALHAGVQAWEKGDLVSADVNGAGERTLKYRDDPTAQRLRPVIQPAFDAVWGLVRRLGEALAQRLQQAFGERETMLSTRETALEQRATIIKQQHTGLTGREAALNEREAALEKRETKVAETEQIQAKHEASQAQLREGLLRLAERSGKPLKTTLEAAMAAAVEEHQTRTRGTQGITR